MKGGREGREEEGNGSYIKEKCVSGLWQKSTVVRTLCLRHNANVGRLTFLAHKNT